MFKPGERVSFLEFEVGIREGAGGVPGKRKFQGNGRSSSTSDAGLQGLSCLPAPVRGRKEHMGRRGFELGSTPASFSMLLSAEMAYRSTMMALEKCSKAKALSSEFECKSPTT